MPSAPAALVRSFTLDGNPAVEVAVAGDTFIFHAYRGNVGSKRIPVEGTKVALAEGNRKDRPTAYESARRVAVAALRYGQVNS